MMFGVQKYECQITSPRGLSVSNDHSSIAGNMTLSYYGNLSSRKWQYMMRSAKNGLYIKIHARLMSIFRMDSSQLIHAT